MTEGWLILIGVAVGGGLGSVARMFLGRWHGSSVPFGILAGNTIASAIVALVATGAHDWLWAALSAGLAGGLSTFSTWAKQTADLWADGRRGDALNNLLLNVFLPVAAALAVLLPQLFGN